jgi:hypothetical protein
MNLIVLQEELKHPDWEISAADSRQRDLAREVCAKHLKDLRREVGTPLKSFRLVGEDTKPLIR